MFKSDLTTIQPLELLETLKSYPFLADFHLSLCSDGEGSIPRYTSRYAICGLIEQNPICRKICQGNIEESVHRAISSNMPVVFRCHAGLLNFAVPFRAGSLPFSCIVGGGVREKDIDLLHMESLARADDVNAFALLEQLETLPTATMEEVENIAEKVRELIPSLVARNLHSILFEKTMQRLSAITGVSAGIDTAEAADEVMALMGETLGILFDIARIAILLPDAGRNSLSVNGLWGLEPEMGNIPLNRLMDIFQRNGSTSVAVIDEECRILFPDIDAGTATCVRFSPKGELIWVLVLFDIMLNPREAILVELLAGRAAAKLAHMKKEQTDSVELSLAEKLMSMLGTLSTADGKDDLNGKILDMAAELVNASSGSLMFINDSGETLRIESALGMNMQLAQSMVVQVGTGIAGKVAANGHPLLVNDIEKDKRIGTPNRPRFKTKSFVSIPIKLKENILGVLNLSDKKNQEIFTETDLRLLTTFVSHASIMIERVLSIERADFLEQLSITDHLTGLYNRRFLKRRMEEELSRSIRQNLNLTVMLIDLDNFKIYNDLCGHLAGDRALKKTARIISETARQMDVVTRYGGEEFCIILPGTSKKESIFVAERIRREIENEDFPHEDNLPQGRLTASIGVSAYPEDGNTDAMLLKAADVALYRAKSEGRNRVVIAEGIAEKAAAEPVRKASNTQK